MAQLRDLLVNGASRFLGVVNFNNEAIFNESVTLNETLNLLKNTDANGKAYNSPALVIGDKTADHLEFDKNDIMSKASETATTSLHINRDGGQVVIGPDGMLTAGIVTIGDGDAATSSTEGELIVNGGIAVSKASIFGNKITSDTLTLTNTSATSHITFSRGNFNYITAPTSGIIAFVVNGQAVGDVNSEFIIKDGEIRPGTTNVTTLGASNYRWSTIYGENLNLSGNATIGDAVTDAHTIKGNTTLTGNLIPGGNSVAYTLGNVDHYWRGLYVGDGTAGAVSNTGVQSGSIIVKGGMSLTNDIAIKSENNDRAIKFVYGKSSNDGYSWQIKYSGSGADDANYLSIESSGTSGTYSPAVRFGLTSLDATFGGHVYPLVNNSKNLGTSSYAWSNIYGYNYYIKSNAYFANGTTYKIDSSGHAVFNNTTANGNLTVKGTAAIAKDTTIGNGTTSTSMTTGALKVDGGVGVEG